MVLGYDTKEFGLFINSNKENSAKLGRVLVV
jgi:hypothetical protein